jgi:hypothetical protein
MFMYLFAVVILSAHAALNVFQYPSGDSNEVRLLSSSVAFGFLDQERRKFELCFFGENNGR